MIDFAVDLVEEHVDLDGSQFSNFQDQSSNAGTLRVLQKRNVVVLEFGSPCLSRSPSSIRDSRHEQQWILPFFDEVSVTFITSCMITGHPVLSCACSTLKSFLSSDERVSKNTLVLWTGIPDKSSRSLWRTNFFAKRISIDLLRTGKFFFVTLHRNPVIPIPHELDLELVGSIAIPGSSPTCTRRAWYEPNSAPPIRASMRSLAEVEVTWILFRTRFLLFSSKQLSEYNKLEAFHEEWWRSIESDRTPILSKWQDWCRPNILRLDVSSMRYAGVVLDVVQRSQYVQDLHDLGLLGKKNTVCLYFWLPSINPELMIE